MTFKFSKISQERLNTVDTQLQDIFNEVIKYYDCSIICGYRTEEEQRQAYDNGVSKCDGLKKISKHQLHLAVDIVPYPTLYSDKNKFYELAGCVKTIAIQKGINIKWGGDWKNFKDLPHWELDK